MSKEKLYAGLNPQDFCSCGAALKKQEGEIFVCTNPKCKKKYVFDWTGQRFSITISKNFISQEKCRLS